MNTKLLKKAIKEKYGRQKDFADALGLCEMSVTNWMTGNATPGTSTVVRICRALDISADELLEIKGECNE